MERTTLIRRADFSPRKIPIDIIFKQNPPGWAKFANVPTDNVSTFNIYTYLNGTNLAFSSREPCINNLINVCE